MQRDLMQTWGQSLLNLRLPAAMPFIFDGLKIAGTLASVTTRRLSGPAGEVLQ